METDKETITITLDRKWARLIRSPFYHVVSALSGVAVTFFPMNLYKYGVAGREWFEWRVIATWLTIVIIPAIHYRLSAPVMRALRATSEPS